MQEQDSPHYLPELGLWEVRAPTLVQALLLDPRLGVRPPAQPLPAHLQGRPGRSLGQAFGRWLRMRDDAGHAAAKARLLQALDALPDETVHALARQQAGLAFAAGWNHGLWATSVCSMAALLGLRPADLDEQKRLLAQMQALARGLAPSASQEQIDAADACCAALLQMLSRSGELPLGLPADDEGANRLALLWQSFEAGAALLGQGLVALSGEPAKRQAGGIAAWLPELQKRPGVILSTRRFAREPLQIGAVPLRPGDGLLLHLSGSETALGFGHGAHRCPGQRLALGIAAAALELVLESNPAWPAEWQVLTLSNARIPIFEETRP